MFAFALLICIVTSLLPNDTTAKVETFVTAKDPKSECGLRNGGPIIQQIMAPTQSVTSLYWQSLDQRLFSISPVEGNVNYYHYLDGKTVANHISQLDNYTMTTFVPVKNGVKQWVIAARRAIFALRVFPKKENDYDVREIQTVAGLGYFTIKARASTDGKFWLGVGQANYTEGDSGALLKINLVNGNVETVEQKYPSYTGLAWSLDDTKLYVIDEISNVIRCYKYNKNTGSISDMTVVFNMTIDSGDKITGTVSSIAIDRNNIIWFGLQDGGAVVEYNPDGRLIIRVIRVPANSVTSLVFGSITFDVLFVATDDTLSGPLGSRIYAITGLGTRGFKDNAVLVSQDVFIAA